MTPDSPAAVLWDMDGTLVDTESYWMRAESALIASFGGSWSYEDGLTLVGNGLETSARIMQKAGVELGVEEIIAHLTARVQQLLEEEGVPWRPGARELLAELRAQQVPTALVTMSRSSMAQQIVDLIGFPAFDLMVTGDMVERPKPDPEAYLLAASRLGVPIEHCVAVEDSVPGLTSAVASGAVAIGVPHIVSLPDDGSATLWPTLAGRTVADIRAVFAAAHRSAAPDAATHDIAAPDAAAHDTELVNP